MVSMNINLQIYENLKKNLQKSRGVAKGEGMVKMTVL